MNDKLTREEKIQLFELVTKFHDETYEEMRKHPDKTKEDYAVIRLMAKIIEGCDNITGVLAYDF